MYELFEAQPVVRAGRRKSAAPLNFTLGNDGKGYSAISNSSNAN